MAKDKTFKQKSKWTKVKNTTAVEWLLEKMQNLNVVNAKGAELVELYIIIQQAKAIEKEQIEEAFIEGGVQYISNIGDDIPPKAEDYYNKTYNK